MQHFLKGALAVGAFTLTMGLAQAQDLAPLNSDSEPCLPPPPEPRSQVCPKR
jgi:hypothetical protein